MGTAALLGPTIADDPNDGGFDPDEEEDEDDDDEVSSNPSHFNLIFNCKFYCSPLLLLVLFLIDCHYKI